MRLDIVILPPKNLSEKIGKQTKRLEKKASLVFSVDNKKLFPHVSLFHVWFKREKLQLVNKKVQAIAQSTTIFKLFFEKINTEGRVFVLDLKRNNKLNRLHKQIVETLAPLRDRNWRKYKEVTGIRKELVTKYGHKHILRFFRPHITLGRVKIEKDLENVPPRIKIPKAGFIADNLAVTKVDSHYSQVIKVLKVFKLSSPSLRATKGSAAISKQEKEIASSQAPRNDIERAVSMLKRGGIVVYPTDTSYGLAVDATNPKAVKKLYKLKGRNFKKPVHVIPPNNWLNKIVKLTPQAKKLIKKFWPGPFTIVLPLKAKGKSWQMLSAGTGTLGVRYPKHRAAQGLVEAFGKPITTTSANIAGGPDSYSLEEVKKQLAMSRYSTNITFLDGGKLKKTKPSTVISIIKDAKILREGPISKKKILKEISNI